MTTVIDAIIVQGVGAATKNMGHQLPKLIAQFPNIKNVHHGSINVRLSKPLDGLNYEYTTSPICWWDAGPDRWQTETFGFLEIKFEYPIDNNTFYRAWLFDCHNSRYHNDPSYRPFFHEVVAEKIEGVAYDKNCRVYLPF
jgi:hypothetical protein